MLTIKSLLGRANHTRYYATNTDINRTSGRNYKMSDNVALSLFLRHSAKLAFPAGKNAKMRACQPQRDITASAIGVIQIL